jgi:hypothetical protein
MPSGTRNLHTGTGASCIQKEKRGRTMKKPCLTVMGERMHKRMEEPAARNKMPTQLVKKQVTGERLVVA